MNEDGKMTRVQVDLLWCYIILLCNTVKPEIFTSRALYFANLATHANSRK